MNALAWFALGFATGVACVVLPLLAWALWPSSPDQTEREKAGWS
jgi:hypothetical protein